MATIQEKLADSLAVLKKYQDGHSENLVIQGASTLGETHTRRLVKNGYLRMVIKGWYIPASPGSEGDSTVWYVSYWSFVSAYLEKNSGRNGVSLQNFHCITIVEKQLYPHSLLSEVRKHPTISFNCRLILPFWISSHRFRMSLKKTSVMESVFTLFLWPC